MKATILNAGYGAWAFEEHAQRMARVMQVEVSDTPAEFNYLLGWEDSRPPAEKIFIPFRSMQLASDKRRLAWVFGHHDIATPKTYLLDSVDQVQQVIARETQSQWVLK